MEISNSNILAIMNDTVSKMALEKSRRIDKWLIDNHGITLDNINKYRLVINCTCFPYKYMLFPKRGRNAKKVIDELEF